MATNLYKLNIYREAYINSIFDYPDDSFFTEKMTMGKKVVITIFQLIASLINKITSFLNWVRRLFVKGTPKSANQIASELGLKQRSLSGDKDSAMNRVQVLFDENKDINIITINPKTIDRNAVLSDDEKIILDHFYYVYELMHDPSFLDNVIKHFHSLVRDGNVNAFKSVLNLLSSGRISNDAKVNAHRLKNITMRMNEIVDFQKKITILGKLISEYMRSDKNKQGAPGTNHQEILNWLISIFYKAQQGLGFIMAKSFDMFELDDSYIGLADNVAQLPPFVGACIDSGMPPAALLKNVIKLTQTSYEKIDTENGLMSVHLLTLKPKVSNKNIMRVALDAMGIRCNATMAKHADLLRGTRLRDSILPITLGWSEYVVVETPVYEEAKDNRDATEIREFLKNMREAFKKYKINPVFIDTFNINNVKIYNDKMVLGVY